MNSLTSVSAETHPTLFTSVGHVEETISSCSTTLETTKIRLPRLTVRTSAFHAENTGSIPVGVAIDELLQKELENAFAAALFLGKITSTAVYYLLAYLV